MEVVPMEPVELNKLRSPGYKKFDPNEEINRQEAFRVRMRVEFKNKLKSITLKHSSKQEYCCDCKTLPPSPEIAPSLANLRRTSTTATLGPKPTVSRKATLGTHEIRSYGISSESAEYLKAHPEFTAADINPKRIPHDDIGNVMAVFTNLHLAHEIAINRCYRLKKIDDTVYPSANADVKANMKEVMWELLADEIAKNASFKITLGLVEGIKNSILSLMMPHNIELRDQLHQVLHMERIENEAKKSGFDFECYLPYILDVLGQICCPSRDAQIEEARKLTDPVEILKAISQLVDDMKTDMENFFINLYRPSIIRGTIENERKKFADFLELEYRLHEDGLRGTRAWLARHCVGVRDPATVIAKAYAELLSWKTKEPWPETLLEDVERLQSLCKILERIGIIGGVVLELGKVFHKIFKKPPPKLRQLFGRYVKLLIPEDQTGDQKKLLTCLEKAAEKVVEALEQIVAKYLNRSLSEKEAKLIYETFVSVAEPHHSYRNLIMRRTRDHAEEIILASNDYHTPVPTTLTSVMYEVAVLVTNFHRVVVHNRACFGELYQDIVEGKNKVPLYPEENDSNWDIGLLETLKKLRSRITTKEEAMLAEKLVSESKGDMTLLETLEDEILSEEISEGAVQLAPTAQAAMAKILDDTIKKPKFNMETKSFQCIDDCDYSDTEINEETPAMIRQSNRNNKELETHENRAFKKFCTDCPC